MSDSKKPMGTDPEGYINLRRIQKWLDEEVQNFYDAVGPNRYADGYNDGIAVFHRNISKRIKRHGK